MKKWKKRARTALQYILFVGGLLLTLAAGLESNDTSFYFMTLGLTLASIGAWLSCIDHPDSVVWGRTRDDRPYAPIPAIGIAVILTICTAIFWFFGLHILLS